MLEIRLLGRFAVRSGSAEVPREDFGGRLPRRLLAVLATRPDEVVARDLLIEALWPRRAPADPDGNLNVLVNRARRALGDPDAVVTVPGGGYRLCRDRASVDAERFRDLVADGGRELAGGRPSTGLRRLRDALALWGEPLAEDAYEEWAQPVRRALWADHQDALEAAADATLLVDQPGEACRLAREAVAAEPLRERAHLLLVRALAASGDRAAALSALGNLRRTLSEELGLEPSDEAADLELRVLDGRPVPAAPAPRPAPDRRGRAPFVGREAELRRLLSVVDGPERVAAVAGAAGSGKSRLLDEVVRRAEVPALVARAFLADAATPWALARTVLAEAVAQDASAATGLPDPARRALAELVLPEVGPDARSSGEVLEHRTRRVLALEGCVRLLASVAAGGALVVVDDLQWADATSLELLARAVTRIDDLVLVVAHRPLERSPDARRLLADLRPATGVVDVDLGRLTAEDITRMAGDADLGSVLSQETDGSPFAVLEVLAALARAGGADDDEVRDQARRAARDGQRRSVLARVARLPRAAQELLRLLAVLGREAPARLLAGATGRPTRDVVGELELLDRSGLVRLGDRGWSTAHDLITDAVSDDLGRTERGRLHRRLADALGEAGDEPGERAAHLLGAGDDAAAAAFAEAAERQLRRHAQPEAGRLAGRGLSAGPEGPVRVRLLEVRAAVRTHAGDLVGARRDHRAALTLASEGPVRARVRTEIARLAVADDDLEQADALVEMALAEAGPDPAARARALSVGSIIDMNRRDDDRAARRADEARRLFAATGDGAGVADVLDARAMATFLDGDVRGGIAAFAAVAGLFRDDGNLLRAVTPLSTRGHGLVFLDEPAAGLEEIDAAVDLAGTLGHPEGRCYALWHRSEALTALGRLDEAAAAAEEARVGAEQVGHKGWTATAWRATGLVREARGDDAGAREAHRRSLGSGGAVPLFACWAHARIALTSLRLGELDRAAEHAAAAVASGPPLGQYEARFAQAAVAVRQGRPDAGEAVEAARRAAEAGGHLVSVALLDAL